MEGVAVVLTPNDITDILRNYLSDNAFIEGLPMFDNDAELKEIAGELFAALYEESARVTKSGDPLFSFAWGNAPYPTWGGDGGSNDLIRISVKHEKDQTRVTIKINPETIGRDSLSYPGAPYREGVYDIVGLFTRGYTAEKYAYGIWESVSPAAQRSPQYVRSHSLGNAPGLAPHSFVDEVIDAFHIKYWRIIKDIKYPSEWHS